MLIESVGKAALGVAIMFYIGLCGCTIRYDDVSKNPEFAPLLNARFTVSTNMLLSGLSLGPGYGKDIDVYVIRPISIRVVGPEILTENILEPGTILTIKSIEKSTVSIPFEGRRIMATVSVLPHKKGVEAPVEIELEYLQSTNYVKQL